MKEPLKEAMLWRREGPLEDGVKCDACSQYCYIPKGHRGVCGVRENKGGTLYTLVYDKVLGLHPDPVEKKPLYHFLPGTRSFSFGTVGCNFHCEFCQNSDMSQAPKPLYGGSGEVFGEKRTPASLVKEALSLGCKSIAYTYNEPAIFIELAHDTMRLAKERGLKNIFVSNGYESEEALELVAPYLDAMNIDLKSFSPEFYSKICGGRFSAVIDTIRRAHKKGIWLEVTTLVIPGRNDSDEELRQIAGFIAGVSADIPWHISRFFPMHRMLDVKPTPLPTLERAYGIGKAAGLKHVYVGNVREDTHNDTVCPKCGSICIRRGPYYGGLENHLADGKCPSCKTGIAGVWS